MMSLNLLLRARHRGEGSLMQMQGWRVCAESWECRLIHSHTPRFKELQGPLVVRHGKLQRVVPHSALVFFQK